MKLVYFAWVREKIGKTEENLALPSDVVTVHDLLNYLRSLGENYNEALSASALIRVAIDHAHAESEDKIADAKEIALFPPMTGG